jgi:hypothetical protein
MVKICQTGLLKLNFETRPKKAFSGFCQKFLQAMDEVENFFFANFKILGPLGCQGWVVIPQNVKKTKSLHPNGDLTQRQIHYRRTNEVCSAQTQTRIGLLEEIPRSGVQIPCLS